MYRDGTDPDYQPPHFAPSCVEAMGTMDEAPSVEVPLGSLRSSSHVLRLVARSRLVESAEEQPPRASQALAVTGSPHTTALAVRGTVGGASPAVASRQDSEETRGCAAFAGEVHSVLAQRQRAAAAAAMPPPPPVRRVTRAAAGVAQLSLAEQAPVESKKRAAGGGVDEQGLFTPALKSGGELGGSRLRVSTGKKLEAAPAAAASAR